MIEKSGIRVVADLTKSEIALVIPHGDLEMTIHLGLEGAKQMREYLDSAINVIQNSR